MSFSYFNVCYLCIQVNAFDTNRKKNTMLKQLSQWLIAIYDYDDTVSTTLASCANDLDNVAVLALPKVDTQLTEKVAVFEF